LTLLYPYGFAAFMDFSQNPILQKRSYTTTKKASDVFLMDLDMKTLLLRYGNGGLETAYIIRQRQVIPLGITGSLDLKRGSFTKRLKSSLKKTIYYL
jgi:hypothetical protein